MDIGRRLREERERLGWTQERLSEAGGVLKRAQVNYESGARKPDADYLHGVSAAGVDVLYVVTGRRSSAANEDSSAQHTKKEGLADDWAEFTQVPRYDIRASAGPGALVDGEHVLNHMAFREDWLRHVLRLNPARLALIDVDGDSMAPTLAHGDMILVDTTEGEGVREGIHVINLGGGLLVKRLRPMMDGSIEVASDNPRYATDVVPAEQLDQLKVVGRVVWQGRRV